jgi:hypothetical protein
MAAGGMFMSEEELERVSALSHTSMPPPLLWQSLSKIGNALT